MIPSIQRCVWVVIAVGLTCGTGVARADEPGLSPAVDEPALEPPMGEAVVQRSVAVSGPSVRIELGFGLSSLLADPDVSEGYGGGLWLAYGLQHRVGFELSAFAANNPYAGQLGEVGNSFISGCITAGPMLSLTRPGAPLMVTIEAALGAYLVVPLLQQSNWSLGVAGGMTFGYRIGQHFGLGFKVRYHLFNLTTISGPELLDVKAFREIGVIDRFEVPAYVAIYL